MLCLQCGQETRLATGSKTRLVCGGYVLAKRELPLTQEALSRLAAGVLGLRRAR